MLSLPLARSPYRLIRKQLLKLISPLLAYLDSKPIPVFLNPGSKTGLSRRVVQRTLALYFMPWRMVALQCGIQHETTGVVVLKKQLSVQQPMSLAQRKCGMDYSAKTALGCVTV